jgi:hypothetical protein
MRRFQLAGAAIAGILFIAANAAAANSLMKSPTAGRNAPGLHLVEDAAPTKKEKKYLEVQLTCPKAGTGTLEEISVNRLGSYEKYRVEYSRNRATAIQISYRLRTWSKFVAAINADLTSNEPDSSASLDLVAGREFVEMGNIKLREVCNGSADARKKYRATLKANQRILGLSPKEYPSNF